MYKHKYQKYKRKYLNLMKRAKKDPEYYQSRTNENFMKYRDSSKVDGLDSNYLGKNNNYKVLVVNVRFNDINKDKIVNRTAKSGKDLILYLQNVDDFDDFTDKYGIVENNKLFIRWSDVAFDYKGFGLDGNTNNELYKKRYVKSEFEHNIYPSWWKNEFDEEENNLVEFLE